MLIFYLFGTVSIRHLLNCSVPDKVLLKSKTATLGSVAILSATSGLEDQKQSGLFFIKSQASLNGPSVANLYKHISKVIN